MLTLEGRLAWLLLLDWLLLDASLLLLDMLA
jgi:hypothetical protein